MLDKAARVSVVKLVVGLGLVGLGVLALIGQTLDNLFHIDMWHFTWPLLIIGLGLTFFVGMVAGGRTTGGLAVPASLLSTIGVLLFYQNLFDRFETWSYAWALLIVAVGAGLMINGAWASNSAAWRHGQRVAKLGILLFLAFGVFFELIIGISGFRGGGFVWPLLLIGLGVYLVLRQAGLRRPTALAGLPSQWTPPDSDRPRE